MVEDAVVLMDEEASCVGSEGIIIGSVNSFKVVGKQGGLSLHQNTKPTCTFGSQRLAG